MKTKHRLGMVLAVAAGITYWAASHRRRLIAEHQAREAVFLQEALDTLVGEGGLVSG